MKTVPEPQSGHEYVEAYRVESYGNSGKFALKLLVDAGRELTKTDISNLRLHAEAIEKSIREESINLDPKTKESAIKEREEILSLFDSQIIFVEEIPNGYWPDGYGKHFPWYVITTKLGRIKIGWRKRVIEIDWSDSIIGKTAWALFPQEDVTKEDKLIHAWGYEKAKEYINTLLA